MNVFIFLKMSFINLFYLLGAFIGFGLLFNLIGNTNKRLLFSIIGSKGGVVVGFIGTLIHEISHAIMCLIFFHKITKIELFRPIQGQKDGVLGRVTHKYNNKNLYHCVGNFFIGIAPLIGGTFVIIILFELLLPEMFFEILDNMSLSKYMYNDMWDNLILLSKDIKYILKEMFFNKHIFSIKYIMFIFFLYSITLHMSLSSKDLEGCASGIIAICITVMIVTFITYLFGVNMSMFSTFLLKYNIIIMLFMVIGLFFLLIMLLILFILSFVSIFFL